LTADALLNYNGTVIEPDYSVEMKMGRSKKMKCTALAIGLAAFVLAPAAFAQDAPAGGGEAPAAGGGAEGYGYEFDDDPLNAGGFGPNDATIRVRPKAARTTLIRPRTSFVPEMLKSVENI
jgi:hypothetical protein